MSRIYDLISGFVVGFGFFLYVFIFEIFLKTTFYDTI